MPKKTYSGYTAETPKKLLLDAGAYFKNFYPGIDTFESAVAAGKLLGATQGGGSASFIPAIRPVEIDGVKGAAKGLEVIDAWDVGITSNVKEVKKETIQAALISTSLDTTTNPDYDIISANNSIALTDYIDNITWIGNLSGTNEPVIIQIYNALATNGLTVNTSDKSEAVIALSFKGHYDDLNLDNPPFKIYYPKEIVNTSAPTSFNFSKAAPADAVFTITSSDNAVAGGVRIEDMYLATANFTINAGVVTIKSSYLATLAIATHDFTILMDKGNNIAVTVAVGA